MNRFVVRALTAVVAMALIGVGMIGTSHTVMTAHAAPAPLTAQARSVRAVKQASGIGCGGGISGPFEFGGKVHAIGTVSCTAPVANISAAIALYKNGSLKIEGLGSKNNTASLTVTTSDSNCLARASWVAEMFGTITFPPGYSPHTSAFDIATPPVTIQC